MVGLAPLLGGGSIRPWALALAAAILALVLWAPRVLRPLARAWMALGERMHRVVSPIALGAIFFGVVTPIAWLRRRLGKDDLRLRRPSALASYWSDLEPSRAREGRFRDQF